jgi:hypothetical protein
VTVLAHNDCVFLLHFLILVLPWRANLLVKGAFNEVFEDALLCGDGFRPLDLVSTCDLLIRGKLHFFLCFPVYKSPSVQKIVLMFF